MFEVIGKVFVGFITVVVCCMVLYGLAMVVGIVTIVGFLNGLSF